ncbi:pre-mrna-splicing factor cwc2 [Cystoisospora suis]|uniref:Pre-mrna-splicing factor cwc2 n=1 Tax=Cystoisospora suis TaxID=483139 RepID=A0A2C6KYU2_9APIC|nr:pre-mrna-splicing factor cwc2 [Cystoisospora suis]
MLVASSSQGDTASVLEHYFCGDNLTERSPGSREDVDRSPAIQPILSCVPQEVSAPTNSLTCPPGSQPALSQNQGCGGGLVSPGPSSDHAASAALLVENGKSAGVTASDQYALYAAYYQWYAQAAHEAQKRPRVEDIQQSGAKEEPYPDKNKPLVTNWMRRPARQQIDQHEASRYSHSEGGTEYNIWYGKYLTDRYNKPSYLDRENAPYKCNPKKDAGYTKANTDASGEHFFCIFFAKGACWLGKDCRYRHSLPTLDDEGYLEWSHDIFGRERFKTHKDDMDGVGSFSHDCKTLFAAGLRIDNGVPDGLKKMEEFLKKEFGVWGDVTNVRVIPKKNIAFITYAYRVQAEFAKVAMADQNLGKYAPLLAVRWAHTDGNAKRRAEAEEEERKRQKLLVGPDLPPESAPPPAATSAPALPIEVNSGDAVADAAFLYETLEAHCDVWQKYWAEAQEKSQREIDRQERLPLREKCLEEWSLLYGHVENQQTADFSQVTLHPLDGTNTPGKTVPNATAESFGEEEAMARMQNILSRVDGLDAGAFEVKV